MAHGKSLELRQIGPSEPQWVHQHTAPSRELRERMPFKYGSHPGRCAPYINPARDLRKGRRLRKRPT